MFETYDQPQPPEHYGQIEHGGVWWNKDDYEQMMVEREKYLEAERASDEIFISTIRQSRIVQTFRETGAVQTIANSNPWDEEETYMLLKIAMAEAEGEDTEGKALVMLTVINRVHSDAFPNSIQEVITQAKQFTAYENGRYGRVEPSEDCYSALELITKAQWDGSQGATYFEHTTENETWHSKNLKTLFTHQNHTFYKENE